jgi:hypothetical protein
MEFTDESAHSTAVQAFTLDIRTARYLLSLGLLSERFGDESDLSIEEESSDRSSFDTSN